MTVTAVTRATTAPVQVWRLADLTGDGQVAHTLAAGRAEAWVIRPDGHIAAVLTTPTVTTLGAAVRRAIALG